MCVAAAGVFGVIGKLSAAVRILDATFVLCVAWDQPGAEIFLVAAEIYLTALGYTRRLLE